MEQAQDELLGKLFNNIVEFFEERSKPKQGMSMSLFQIACLGSPERTIQGELFYWLRLAEFKAVLECGLMDNQRNIDILVFNNGGNPLVSIELKHYSWNQGTTKPLQKNLDADYGKCFPTQWIIQVGLYTKISKVDTHPFTFHGLYRFPSKYYKGCPSSREPENEMKLWMKYNSFIKSKSCFIFIPDDEVIFSIPTQPDETKVTGCVGYFVGLRQSSHRVHL